MFSECGVLEMMVGMGVVRMDIRVAGHRSYLNAPGSYKYRERWCLMEKQPWEHRGEMQVSLPLGQNEERKGECHLSGRAVCSVKTNPTNPVSSNRLVLQFPRMGR